MPEPGIGELLEAVKFACRREAAEYERLIAMLPLRPPKPGKPLPLVRELKKVA
jgi:hypothetical protein